MSENAVLYHEYLDRISIIRKRLIFLQSRRAGLDDNVEISQLDARILSLRETLSDMIYAANRLRLYL